MVIGFDAAVGFDSALVGFDGADLSPAQFTPDDLRVELFLKSPPIWEVVTQSVRSQDGVRISRGRTTEDGESAPSACSLTLNNSSGAYSPRNTAGQYYGRLGRNTPLRVGFGKPAVGETGTGTGATVTYPQVEASIGYGATAVLAVAMCTPVDTLSTPAGYTGAAETDGAAFTVKRSRTTDSDLLPAATSTASGSPAAWTTAHIAIPGATYVTGGTATGDAGDGPGGVGVSGLTTGDLIVVVVAWSADVLGRMQPPWLQGGLDPAEMYMICDSGPHATAPRVAAYAWEQRATHYAVNFNGAMDGLTGSSMTVVQYTGQARYSPRFCGEVADWPIVWSKDENNKTVAIEAGGVSRRLTQSQDAPSVIRAAFGNLPELTNYWPMEDAPGAVDFAPAIGTARMTPVNGISAGAVDAWGGSYPTPDFTGHGAQATITPSNAAPVGFGCITAIPAAGTAAGNNLIFGSFEVAGAADISTVGVEYTNSTTLTAKVQYAGGTTASTSLGSLVGICPDGLLGQQLFIYVALAQSGADVLWAVTLINITPGSDYVQLVAGPASYVAHTLGALNRITLGVESGTGTTIGTNEVTHGHAFVTPSSTFTNAISRTYAARGYDSATVTGSLVDQAQNERVPTTFVFPDEDNLTCSPGSPGNLMSRLQELALTGQGLLQDAAGFPGLEYRPNASIISRAPVYTFSYSGTTFTDPLYPVDDDAVTLNDATVMMPRGGQARVTVETGALGCQAAGVGRYANEFTAPTIDAFGARDLASWLAAQGTTDLARWPLVGLRMSAAGNVDLPMPRFSIGDTVRMSNLPSWSGPATLDLVVVGMLDDVSDALWTVTLITRPAELYRVLIWDDATFGVWADSAAPATTDRRWGL